MGPLGKSVGTLFLDRERPRAVAEVSQGMRRAFGEGLSMIVFPEGTTTPGETVAAFHTALFEPALRADVPVQGVLLSYAPRHGRDPSDLAAWTGDASFVPHLYRLFRSGGLKVEARFKFAERSGGDRRAVAARVREWMLEEISGTAARSFLPRSAVQNAR
jgi:1-acyl-sn-glycerol-3-phosphate acyltransferase